MLNQTQVKNVTAFINKDWQKAFTKNKKSSPNSAGLQVTNIKGQYFLAEKLDLDVTPIEYNQFTIYLIKKTFSGYDYTSVTTSEVNQWGFNRDATTNTPILDKPITGVVYQCVVMLTSDDDVTKAKSYGHNFIPVSIWHGYETDSTDEVVDRHKNALDKFNERLTKFGADIESLPILRQFALDSRESWDTKSFKVSANNACRPLQVGETVWFTASGGRRKGIVTSTKGTSQISVAYVTPTSPNEFKVRRQPITYCLVEPVPTIHWTPNQNNLIKSEQLVEA